MEKIYKEKTYEAARAKACEELGLSDDQLTAEVLETGSKGFLGIGAKDYVVKITYTPDACMMVRSYLEGLFRKMNIDDAAIDITVEKETVNVQVSGDGCDFLLENRGEAVDALQLLLSLLVTKELGEYYKISFNVNDYKEKTKERLEALALKTADRVVKQRRKVTLPAMTSFQRRIIHAKLQDYKDVTTYSIGKDPDRKVVVSYTGEDGPAPRRDGGSRGRNGSGNGRRDRKGGKGGYERRERRPRVSEPAGEPYTGEITRLPGEKLSGSAAKKDTEVTGGTPFTMGE